MNANLIRTLAVVLAIPLLGALSGMGALGCSGSDGDVDVDSDADTDSDSDGDSDADGDPDCEYWELFPEDDAITTYPYPAGPGGYGFQTSMCPATFPFWGTRGEAIHNICLKDQDGNDVCLADYHNSPDYDLLFIDFSATWCAPCREMAQNEWRLLEGMAERGWRIKWITVLLDAGSSQELTPPTQADAKWWQEIGWIPSHLLPPEYDQEGPVLWDETQQWGAKVFSDWWPNRPLGGYPAWMLVHPSNMLIWDAIVGLAFDAMDPELFNEWLDLFDAELRKFSENPGACATDPCEILGPQDTDSDTTN